MSCVSSNHPFVLLMKFLTVFDFYRNDWGAILLIDERFGKSPKYRNGKNVFATGYVEHRLRLN